MVLTSAAPTFFMPRMPSTFPWTNKSTTCCGGKNNGSHTSQSEPNPGHSAKVHALRFTKYKVISAAKKDGEKTAKRAVAAKKVPEHLNMESRKVDGVYDIFGGRLGHSGLVFQQNFSVRSYELGLDGKATVGCVMKFLQETSIQHCRSLGILDGGFGSTPEMTKRGLVWVLRKLQLVVDNYPSWADVIQIDSWMGASGNNGQLRDWIFRDYGTGEILIQATGLFVLMNMKTRKLSKVIPEIRDELKPGSVDSDPLIDIHNTKLGRLNIDARNYVKKGLTPGWSDLDVNQHVSNAKYVDWVFQSIPVSTLESYELSSMTLEYRRECRKDSVLQSLTAVARDGIGQSANKEGVEFDHLLRLETGSEILRARTMWRAKN